LGDKSFRLLTTRALTGIMELCHHNLKTVIFPDSTWQTPLVTEWIAALAKFSCPHLIKLELGYADIDNGLFAKLVRNNPNLKSLTWRMVSDVWLEFPDIICDKLERLKISRCDDASIRSLIGHCPNLTHFEVKCLTAVSKETLDEFFAHCPKLDTLKIFRMENTKFNFESLGTFWQMPLKKLVIWSDPDRQIKDAALKKISESFSELKSLELRFLSVTNDGVAALASLENLRKLTLSWIKGNIDEGVRQVALCGQLEEANFDINLSPGTFETFLQSCPDLRFLSVHSVTQINSYAQTCDIMRACILKPGIRKGKRNLTISICDRDTAAIWISDYVQVALDLLEARDGRVIKFVHSDLL